MSLYIAEANQAAVLRRIGNRNQNAIINNSFKAEKENHGIPEPIIASESKRTNFKISKMGSGAPSSTSNVCLYFIAIFIPFLPVLLRRGCGADLLINICLDILGWIPGVLHSWWIISQSEVHPKSMGRADGRRPV